MASISDILAELERDLRARLDPLGYTEGENGAYLTGHAPHIAPLAYHFWRYAPLDARGLEMAEEECGRYIHPAYKEFLSCMNGLRLFKMSLHGTIGGAVDRSSAGIGQPISISYQNVVERPAYIPAGHLGIGAINGAWHSQGHLYLTSTGEVELYNAECDLIGAKWPSLGDFLESEVRRQLSLHDAVGHFIPGGKHLPGYTDAWESIAEAAHAERQGNGLQRKVQRTLRRFVPPRS